MSPVYWFFIAWIGGGIVLATLLVVRTLSRPYALPFALLGFGAAGFGARLLGYHTLQVTFASGVLACLLAALLGYALQRLR